MYNVLGKVYLFTVYSVEGIVYSVKCTVYNVKCPVYIVEYSRTL